MKDEEVAIVKMDATANDVPPAFEVRGFPTLFFLPKDSKDKPQQYQVRPLRPCLPMTLFFCSFRSYHIYCEAPVIEVILCFKLSLKLHEF